MVRTQPAPEPACFLARRTALCSQCDESPQVRASDTAVQDVSDDGDRQPFDRTELLAHRVEIEQRLRWMLVIAVPRVNKRDFDFLSQLLQDTIRLQANDACIDAHGFECTDCIVDGLAFLYAGFCCREIQHVGSKPLLRQFKGEPSSCTIFKK